MAQKAGMRIDDLFRLRAVGAVAIAPNGRSIAFELKRFDLADNKNYVQLMLVDADSGAIRPLTAAAKHSDTGPRFSPDGDRLAFVSTREKIAALFVLPLTGGEPTRLTDLDGSVSDFAWSPDGRRIAYVYQPLNEREKLERDEKHDEVRRRPQFKHITRLLHKYDGVGFWNGHYRHVFVINSAGGKPRQLTHGSFDDAKPEFSPDGRQIAFLSNRDENPDLNADQSAIHVVRSSGGRPRRVTPPPGSVSNFSWSPDGQRLAYIGMPNKPLQWSQHEEHVWLVDAAGGKPRRISRDIDNACVNTTLGDVTGMLFDALPPIWSPDGRRVLVLVSEQGAVHPYEVPVHRGASRRLFGGPVNLYCVQRTAPTGRIALALGSATNPGDVYVADPDQGFAPRRLTFVNQPVLARIDVVEPEEHWFRGRGGRIHGWVLRPPGFDPRKRYPAILQVHGGPMAQYGCAMFHEMQVLAARGFVVVFTNPRGSTGYGRDHRLAIVRDWGNLDHQDIRTVGDWIFRQRYIDPKRVGITGGSYGGFMTNWVIAHESRYAAAVTQRGCVNFDSLFGTSDIGHPLGSELGGIPWRNARLREQSPLSYVEKVHTPLLIIHSEQDLRCSIEQAQQLFTALKFLGREVEFVAFEGESHGLSRGGRPQNRAERLRRIIGWFERHLRPK